MREILFRGKPRNLKAYGWVHGQLLHHSEKLSKIYSDEIDHPVGVVPETVGQYTGLTDKNGKKIFEGDIVSVKIGGLKRQGVVFYEDTATRFGLAIGTEKNFSFLGRQMAKMYEVEVIGNIHDNPDLLEVTE